MKQTDVRFYTNFKRNPPYQFCEYWINPGFGIMADIVSLFQVSAGSFHTKSPNIQMHVYSPVTDACIFPGDYLRFERNLNLQENDGYMHNFTVQCQIFLDLWPSERRYRLFIFCMHCNVNGFLAFSNVQSFLIFSIKPNYQYWLNCTRRIRICTQILHIIRNTYGYCSGIVT